MFVWQQPRTATRVALHCNRWRKIDASVSSCHIRNAAPKRLMAALLFENKFNRTRIRWRQRCKCREEWAVVNITKCRLKALTACCYVWGTREQTFAYLHIQGPRIRIFLGYPNRPLWRCPPPFPTGSITKKLPPSTTRPNPTTRTTTIIGQ